MNSIYIVLLAIDYLSPLTKCNAYSLEHKDFRIRNLNMYSFVLYETTIGQTDDIQ